MLPELLFSVGSSMQDISRDDFSLLNGECVVDKDCVIIRNSSANTGATQLPTITAASSPLTSNIVDAYNVCPPSSHLHRNGTKSPNLESVNIKLEETNSSDLYNSTSLWHHHHHHSHRTTDKGVSKLLLRSSDDPLISRGATSVDDDNPNELKSMMVTNSPINHDISSDTVISITDTAEPIPQPPVLVKKSRASNNQGASRTKKKSAFKLRFHHQALPPEYLSHYEATQNQLSAKLNFNNNNITNSTKVEDVDLFNKKSSPILTKPNDRSLTNSQENVRNWLQKIAEMQEAAAAKEAAELAIAAETTIGTSISEEIDEMDGICEVPSLSIPAKEEPSASKPSRIINYSDLPYMGEMTLENSKPRRGRKPKKADICHLIYKNYGTVFPGTPKNLCSMEIEKSGSILAKKLTEIVTKEANEKTVVDEEPLNLCLRDQSDSYTISSDDEDSVNDYETSSNATPHELTSDSLTDNFLAKNLKLSLSSFKNTSTASPVPNEAGKLEQVHPLLKKEDDKGSPSVANCAKWNDERVFMHPVALYYQKMIDSNNFQHPSQSESPSTVNSSTTSLTVKQPSPSPKREGKSPLMQIKREKFERPETCSTPSSIKSGISLATTNGACSNLNQPTQKRKRSAIFIPPMPAENTANPPTEVSICKFKFTGGAKPTLQEKKMLSVDSEGNYRYFSGTGDKSSRGYEFFPRESLQQSGVIPGVNCSGAFLNATGEKISNDLPPPSAGLSNELLQIPDTPPGSLLLPSGLSSSLRREHRSNFSHDRKKRKSKRSIQREKLEQTFKDKGFLIQTQQLESAEGATYCKFRQLKKFTRYLFRSWKDYLPGDVQHAQAAAAAAALVTGTSTRKSILTSNHQSSAIESIRNHVESNMNKAAAAAVNAAANKI